MRLIVNRQPDSARESALIPAGFFSPAVGMIWIAPERARSKTSVGKELLMAVRAIPEGYHTITPNIVVRDARKAIDFYKKAFGAEEIMAMTGPGGKIMHAEIRMGN